MNNKISHGKHEINPSYFIIFIIIKDVHVVIIPREFFVYGIPLEHMRGKTLSENCVFLSFYL